jgi:hypothetical protein
MYVIYLPSIGRIHVFKSDCKCCIIYKLSWIYVDISEVENISVARGPSLEEVTLEPADTEELDKFLNDANTAEEASRDSCADVHKPVK